MSHVGHPGPADVLLVVEVADTTVAFERHTKLPLYARHGLPEAWLIDLPARVLEIHRGSGEGGYARVEPLGPEDLAAVPVPGLPATAVDLTGLPQAPATPPRRPCRFVSFPFPTGEGQGEGPHRL